MDWYHPCSYNAAQKTLFHRVARHRLIQLALRLQFSADSYDVRSNLGGIAVSGEIILHHDAVYIQICQPATRHDTGILIRTCQGRADFCGGANHFEPVRLLDDLTILATRVRNIMSQSASLAVRC